MKFRISSGYGELSEVRNNIPHNGIDIPMPENTVLRSVTDGYVERILHNNSIGNGLVIKDQEGRSFIYGHLNKIEVQGPGERIAKGQEIALSGNTGNSTGPHLHFAEKDPSGHFVDPTHLGPDVAAMSGDGFNLGQFLLDKYNHFADKVISAEMSTVVQPAQHTLQDWLISLGHTLTDLMPEIGTGITIAAGIAIMFTGNFPKYFVRWGFAMMGVISWIILGK